MATTKVTTGGITDATIATADIADQAVTLAKLPHGTSSNDGKFLRANNGADPSFETVSIPAGTTINSNADNRVITGSGTANTLNGESNLTWDGNLFTVNGTSTDNPVKINSTNANGPHLRFQNSGTDKSYVGQAAGISGSLGDANAFAIRSAGNFVISTDNNNTPNFKIDTAGKVGIGETPTDALLVIKGASDASTMPSIRLKDGTDTREAWISNASGDLILANGGNDNTPHCRLIMYDGNIMQFNTADTQRMRIDSNGRLGLGTHTGLPNTKVDIGLGVYAASGDDEAADWGANNVFQLTATGGNAANNQVLLVGAHSGGVGQIASGIGFGRDSTTNWGTYLSFKTHPTATSNIDQLREVMRIGSDGRTSITTNSSYGNRLTDPSSSADDLVISGDSNTGITIYTNSTSSTSNIFFADSGDADVGKFQYLHNNNQFRLYLNANGTPAMQWNHDLTIYFNGNMYSNGNSYSTGSDLRLKSNLVRFTNTLDNLKKLTGYKFDIKCGENRDSTRKSAGVIAQDVEKVYPELVEEVDGYKHLEYSAFTGILVEAVKELTTKVETLETKVAALTA